MKDWPLSDTSGLTREDERYLTTLAIAADVPAWKLWWALVFSDRSVWNDFERQRLQIIMHNRR